MSSIVTILLYHYYYLFYLYFYYYYYYYYYDMIEAQTSDFGIWSSLNCKRKSALRVDMKTMIFVKPVTQPMLLYTVWNYTSLRARALNLVPFFFFFFFLTWTCAPMFSRPCPFPCAFLFDFALVSKHEHAVWGEAWIAYGDSSLACEYTQDS